MITSIKVYKETIFKPHNLAGRKNELLDQARVILSKPSIEGSLTIESWMLELDESEILLEEIENSLNCSNLGLKKLPKWFKKLRIGGYFKCNFNELTSLENLPQSMYALNCSWNKLTSLNGCPKNLYNFDCSGNQLTNLIDGPINVINHYWCTHNLKMTSLHGLAKNIGGNLHANGLGFKLSDIPKTTIIKGEILI